MIKFTLEEARELLLAALEVAARDGQHEATARIADALVGLKSVYVRQTRLWEWRENVSARGRGWFSDKRWAYWLRVTQFLVDLLEAVEVELGSAFRAKEVK